MRAVRLMFIVLSPPHSAHNMFLNVLVVDVLVLHVTVISLTAA
jgi:hypothetical protein